MVDHSLYKCDEVKGGHRAFIVERGRDFKSKVSILVRESRGRMETLRQRHRKALEEQAELKMVTYKPWDM